MPLNQKYVDGLEFCKNPRNGFAENQGVGLGKLLEAVKILHAAGFTTHILATVDKDGSLFSDCLFVRPPTNKKTIKVDMAMDAFIAIAKLTPSESDKVMLPDLVNGVSVCRFWWD